MIDRPAAPSSLPARPSVPAWPFAFIGAAGLLGASGVAVGAAGAHAGGGDLARLSSTFLLIHAAVVVAAAGAALALRRPSAPLAAVLGLLTVGAALFGGELALAALADWRPLPSAAPAGGLCLIAGWLGLSVWAVAAGLRRR